MCFGVVIKYLTISQHDDLYTTLDKMRHLLVSHYVGDDVQSFNVVLCIKMQVQKLYFHYNKFCPLNQTQTWLFFFQLQFELFSHNNHKVIAEDINMPHGIMVLQL
jgi:hypothetical protein